VALIPVAHTIGTDFKPARRKPPGERILGTDFKPARRKPPGERIHWDRW
jgi:hypothetical protein